MIGSRVVSTVMVFFVAQLGMSPLVMASRDEDAILEVSSGSHFVKRSHAKDLPATKTKTNQVEAHPAAAKLAQVKPHAAELDSKLDTAVKPSVAHHEGKPTAQLPKSPMQELATKAEKKDLDPSTRMSPDVRKQMDIFDDASQEALAAFQDPEMGNQQRSQRVNRALARASQALMHMQAMPEALSDAHFAKVLRQKQNSLIRLSDPIPASLAQTQQESTVAIEEHPSSAAKMTPEMRQKVKAFSAVALQALANGKNPGLSNDEKRKGVQAALKQAAAAMGSIASMTHLKNVPGIAERLAHFQKLTDGGPA